MEEIGGDGIHDPISPTADLLRTFRHQHGAWADAVEDSAVLGNPLHSAAARTALETVHEVELSMARAVLESAARTVRHRDETQLDPTGRLLLDRLREAVASTSLLDPDVELQRIEACRAEVLAHVRTGDLSEALIWARLTELQDELTMLTEPVFACVRALCADAAARQ